MNSLGLASVAWTLIAGVLCLGVTARVLVLAVLVGLCVDVVAGVMIWRWGRRLGQAS